jgi:hypothetical protein
MRNGGTSGVRILTVELLDDQSFWKLKSPEKKKIHPRKPMIVVFVSN